MKIELHLLQNFAPSNLNRDDTGAPKSCQFGGVMRGRISSQSWKRAARRYVEARGLLSKDELGYRSRRFKQTLIGCLRKDEDALIKIDGEPYSDKAAPIAADVAVRSFKAKMKDDLTAYLLFVGQGEIKKAVEL